MSESGRRGTAPLVLGAVAVTLVAGVVQLGAGALALSPGEVLGAVFDPEVWGQPGLLLRLLLGEGLAGRLALTAPEPVSTATLVVWNVRLPRLLCALLVGANLALSGSVFQAITRNELAGPYLLGVSSGAGLAILSVVVVWPVAGPHLPLVAMVGAGLAFLTVYVIAWRRGTSPVRLVLAGVIVAAVTGSLQTALFFAAGDIHVVQSALAWTTGSLTGVGWAQVRLIAPWSLISATLALAGARHLDVLLLGDDTAGALGLRVERTRFLLALTAISAAASAVAVAGMVGFVGLIVPHVVRKQVGSRHALLLPGCLAVGAALMTAADTGARLALNPRQIPVGIVTGLFGGLFFLHILRRSGDLHRP